MEEQSQLAHVDINTLSDEELSKLDLTQLNTAPDDEVDETQTVETVEPTADDNANHQVDDTPDEADLETPETDLPETVAPQEVTQPADVETPEQIEDKSPTSDDVDYKAFYDKVTASFKANGRDLSITEPDDVVAMMQRGAGFAKKMATLKPSMRILRTLENHKIGESDLGYLIDLHNKNPEAISKLIKDSGVDVYSLDAEKATDYKTQAAIATDGEVELDTVVQELTASSPTFQNTLNTIVAQWDQQSTQVIANNPSLLRVLDGHAQHGFFDKVMTEVERLRAIGGHIDGLSDFDAYRKVGDDMNTRGMFGQPKSEPTQVVQSQTAPLAAPASIAQTQQADLNAKRRAASAPRPAVKTQAREPDYGNMSDDELLAALDTRQ